MLLGANPDQLHNTASRFKASSAALEASRSTVNGAVVAAWWAGPIAIRFREDWQSRLGPLLSSSATMLTALSKELEVQRQQQITASRAESVGGSAGGSPTGSSGGLDLIPDSLEVELSTVQVLQKVLATTRIVDVVGHMRAGKWIAPYTRWAPGTAEEMSKVFGSAAEVTRFGKYANRLGWAAVAVNTFQQGYDDWGKYQADEFTGRVVTRAAIEGGVNWGATALAGAAAGAWGGPAGIVVGIAVVGGWYFFSHSDIGKDFIGGVIDAGGWVGDKAGDLIDGAGDVLGDVGDALCFWD
jgi:hypothetical protein